MAAGFAAIDKKQNTHGMNKKLPLHPFEFSLLEQMLGRQFVAEKKNGHQADK